MTNPDCLMSYNASEVVIGSPNQRPIAGTIQSIEISAHVALIKLKKPMKFVINDNQALEPICIDASNDASLFDDEMFGYKYEYREYCYIEPLAGLYYDMADCLAGKYTCLFTYGVAYVHGGYLPNDDKLRVFLKGIGSRPKHNAEANNSYECTNYSKFYYKYFGDQ